MFSLCSKRAFIACLFVVMLAAIVFAADAATANTVIALPPWLQALLGIGGAAGAGGLGVLAAVGKKVSRALKLFEDCKIVVSETIDIANYVKAEIRSPEAVKEWNEWIDASATLLKDTGNASLVAKGEMLLKKKIAVAA